MLILQESFINQQALVFNDQNKLEEQNLVRTDTNYIEYNLNNSLNEVNSNVDGSIKPNTLSFNCTSNIQTYKFIEEQNLEFVDYSDIQSNILDKSTEERDVGLIAQSDHSDFQSNMSDGSDRQSDLSDITNIDINEYGEYDDLYAGKPRNLEDINQEFPSKEYAEFMNIITRFHVQNTLANAFIKFFNRYSNRNDCPLPSTSKAGRTFIENLNLPNFGWRKEVIFEYEDLEYALEFRTKRRAKHSNWGPCKTSKHPVFMTLGNIPLTCRNKVDAKVLLSYIPNLEHHSTSENYSAKFRAATRKLFYRAFAAMLRLLRSLSNTGVHFYVN
ncbi:7670_t:CDS:2, partial [Gigaspora rosea]